MEVRSIQNSKGIFFAAVSTVLGALATITYKPLMLGGIEPATLALLESFTIIGFLFFMAKPWRLFKCQRRTRNLVFVASIFQSIATTSFFLGLNYLEPITFGFISRNQVVFSILLGFYFLAERHSMATWTFIALGLVGSLILCFADMGIMNPLGVVFAFLYCFCFSVRNFIVRKYRHTPVIMCIFYGYLLSFVCLSVLQFAGYFAPFAMPAPVDLVKIVSVAILAALGAMYFFQLALRHETMSLVTSIRTFSPFIVTLYFGWEIQYNFPPLKLFGIFVMTVAILTLVYSYREKETVKEEVKEVVTPQSA